MKPSRERLTTLSAETGFEANTLEKVSRLLDLLNALQSHPFLKGRLALKGGTALNLFLSDIPRLSIDADLNYIGALDKDTMLSERPRVEKAVEAVLGREDLRIQRRPTEHAGGKWLLRYQSALGGGENLELDLNYMFRIPLWPVSVRSSKQLGANQTQDFPVVDIYELIAGKLAALFSRRASRDLFDVHRLMTQNTWDAVRLRLGFVLFGAMNRKDWRSVSLDDIDFDLKELERALVPVLSRQVLEEIEDVSVWASQMVGECRQALTFLLPFTVPEREFLHHLLDRGEIKPELLTSNAELREKINQHPLLEWKAINVRKSNKS